MKIKCLHYRRNFKEKKNKTVKQNIFFTIASYPQIKSIVNIYKNRNLQKHLNTIFLTTFTISINCKNKSYRF